MDLSWRIGFGLLGFLYLSIALTGPYRTRRARHSPDVELSSYQETAFQSAEVTATPLPQPTVFRRKEPSLIYTALCPVHNSTDDPNSRGLSFTWDMETGMAHCLWCGWGGRLAKPIEGRVHPRFFPKVFTLVLSM